MIIVNQLTKPYGVNKGIFDLTFTVKKGEVFGFLGPNGAGKTTTIRHLLGFITPDQGNCTINDLDTFHHAQTIHKTLGYISGEIAFFQHMKGIDFLKFMAALRNMDSFHKMHELIEFLDIDTTGIIRKMSKGMKQKLAIVTAFMHDPDILILDEPTSGLDPLMQSKFVELIKQEKAKGKTILMSSHNFEEIERTCDRALIIKHGKQMALNDIDTLKDIQRKVFLITLEHISDRNTLLENNLKIVKDNGTQIEIEVSGSPNELLRQLAKCNVKSLDTKHQNLEDVFMHYYHEGDETDE